jgi:hypothetical protein
MSETDNGGQHVTSPISPQELDRRVADGLEVTLLWHPRTNRLTIEVYDDLAEQMFVLDVAPECAHDAFRHPYAYAPTAIVLKAAGRRAVSVPQSGVGSCAQRRSRTFVPAAGVRRAD